jgi:metal-responsive CopG/Arc/MetJ family transcriptional regulator
MFISVLEEVGRMSRRRTGTRYVPITISLKPSMVDEIEAELSPKQSRSQFIAAAISAKLDGEHERVEEISSLRLCAVLLNRGDITLELFEALRHQLKGKESLKQQSEQP